MREAFSLEQQNSLQMGQVQSNCFFQVFQNLTVKRQTKRDCEHQGSSMFSQSDIPIGSNVSNLPSIVLPSRIPVVSLKT